MKLLLENWREFLNEDVEVEPIPINQLLYLMGETDGSAQHTARDFLKDNTVLISPDEKTWRRLSPVYTHPPAVYGYIKINNAPSQRILSRKAYKAIGGNFPEHSDEYKERQRDASRTQRLANMGGMPGAWLEEGWRGFLNERVTDQVYADVIDFIVDVYADPKNYKYISKEEEEEYEISPEVWARMFDLGGELEKFTEPAPEEVEVPLTTYVLQLKEPRVHDMIGELFDTIPEAEELFPSGGPFYETFMYLRIKAYYADTDRLPDATTKELQGGANLGGYWAPMGTPEDEGLPILAINFGSNFFEPKIGYEKFTNLSNNKILNLLKANKGVLRDILEHEFTHMLNYTRTGVGKRAKGLPRHRRGKADEERRAYANSTEEIQARLIPIFKTVQNVISGEEAPAEKTPGHFSPAMASHELGHALRSTDKIAGIIALEVTNYKGNESLSNMVKYLFRIYELEHKGFLDVTSQANKKRISQRFYEFAQDLVNQTNKTKEER